MFNKGKEKFDIFEKITIPELFSVNTEKDTEELKQIGQIWREFFDVYVRMKSYDVETETTYLEDLRKRLKIWLELYISLNGAESITPYIHAFVFHLPEFIKIHTNMLSYSCTPI